MQIKDLTYDIVIPIDGVVWTQDNAMVDYCNEILNNVYKEYTLIDIPYVFHDAFKKWADGTKWRFDGMYNLMKIQFEPLENYNRIEEGGWTDSASGNITDSGTIGTVGHNARKHDSLNVTTTDAATSDKTSTTRAGMTATQHPYDVRTDDIGERKSTHHTDPYGYSDDNNTTVTNNLRKVTQNDTTHTFNDYRVHGNIGVTTSQQMLVSDVEMRNKFDFCSIAMRDLINYICKGGIYIED